MGKSIKAILLILFFCLLSNISFATNELFSVNNIKIDITDKNTLSAKNKAIPEAQKKAFSLLIKRLSMLSDNDITSLNISNNEINSLITNFSISNEKTSNVRYTGEFNFKFNPKKTSDFLKDKKISFTAIKSTPVLVIPAWVNTDGSIILWEEQNIWKEAWEKFPNDSFLVPTKIPLGDLNDISQISIEEIKNDKLDNLKNILKRYDIKYVTIAKAKKVDNNLQVDIHRYGEDEISYKSSILIEGLKKTYKEVLTEAINRVNYELSNLWKTKTITKPGEISYIDASINLSSLKDLNKIKNILKDITIVNNFKENILTTNKVIFDIYYQGSFFDLKLALSQQGILAEKINTNSCQLTWE